MQRNLLWMSRSEHLQALTHAGTGNASGAGFEAMQQFPLDVDCSGMPQTTPAVPWNQNDLEMAPFATNNPADSAVGLGEDMTVNQTAYPINQQPVGASSFGSGMAFNQTVYPGDHQSDAAALLGSGMIFDQMASPVNFQPVAAPSFGSETTINPMAYSVNHQPDVAASSGTGMTVHQMTHLVNQIRTAPTSGPATTAGQTAYPGQTMIAPSIARPPVFLLQVFTNPFHDPRDAQLETGQLWMRHAQLAILLIGPPFPSWLTTAQNITREQLNYLYTPEFRQAYANAEVEAAAAALRAFREEFRVEYF